MILEQLVKHYDVLFNSGAPDIAPIGYSTAEISFAILLSLEGDVVDLLDLRDDSGKKMHPRTMIVPFQRLRTSGKFSYFMCDKSKYVFGFEKNSLHPKHFQKFKDFHIQTLKDVHDASACAVVNFVNKWHPDKFYQLPCLAERADDISSANFVFQLDGHLGYIHENETIKNAWEAFFSKQKSDYVAQCLITGETVPIAKVHQSIKRVTGAQPSGAAIVSFNIDSFLSYGKVQSYNAPIGEKSMFKYTTALNYLLSTPNNNSRLGDTTIVFWAERLAPREENFLKGLLEPPIKARDENSLQESGGRADRKIEERLDTETEVEKSVSDVLDGIRGGRYIRDLLPHPDLKFHILGLAPNMSRLSVRFWMTDTFGDFVARVVQHYLDMDIVKPPNAFAVVPTWKLLKEMAVLGKTENIPGTLISSLNYAIFNGTRYSYAMLSAMIGRIRADKNVNYCRAGFIKAFLIRSERKEEEVFTVALDLDNQSSAYLLGRLFSLLEKAQEDAAGSKLNSTIKDKYFGSASVTPASVFPQLLRLSQHHLSKFQYGAMVDKKIQEVLNGLDGSKTFPTHLSLEQQGEFILGYYHQKQANYEFKPKVPVE